MKKKSLGWFPGFWSKQLDLPVIDTGGMQEEQVWRERSGAQCWTCEGWMSHQHSARLYCCSKSSLPFLSHWLCSWPHDLVTSTACEQMWHMPCLEASKISTCPLVPVLCYKRIAQTRLRWYLQPGVQDGEDRQRRSTYETKWKSEPNPQPGARMKLNGKHINKK